jgi:transcriptional regulator with XRE-family HTH domain
VHRGYELAALAKRAVVTLVRTGVAEGVEEVVVNTLEPLVQVLGARVRQVRRARGLTLTSLAASAGLSHSFLSKFERGLASPSMASLAQIARALGTSQLELLAGTEPDGVPDHPAVQVQRAGEGATGPYGLGHARLLVNGSRRFQPMECEGDNTDPGDYYVHAEDEFLHVTAGTVVVDLAEQGTVTLTTGDSVYLNGGVAHRWSTGGPEGYRLFLVKERTRPG